MSLNNTTNLDYQDFDENKYFLADWLFKYGYTDCSKNIQTTNNRRLYNLYVDIIIEEAKSRNDFEMIDLLQFSGFVYPSKIKHTLSRHQLKGVN